jgi:hypothetical protein
MVGRGVAKVQELAPRVLELTSMELAMLTEARSIHTQALKVLVEEGWEQSLL